MKKIILNVNSEYGKLKSVLVNDGHTLVDTKYEKIFQKKYGSCMEEETKYHPEEGNIKATIAMKQHKAFLDLLKSKGIELVYTKNVKE